MKKIVLSIICLFSILFSVSSCIEISVAQDESNDSQSNSMLREDETIYLAMTAYIDVASAEGEEIVLKSQNIFKVLSAEKIPEPEKANMVLKVLGKDYDCAYARKGVVGHNTPSYVYKSEAGDEIEITNSGKITYYASAESFVHYSGAVKEGEALSPEESLSEAKKYLSELFGEETASRFSSDLPDTSTSKVWIRFKPVNNDFGAYKTSEQITLVLSETGELLSFYAYNVNDYLNYQIPANFNDEKIKEIVDASLTDNKSDMEISDKKNLVILSDGRKACYTSFRLIDGEAAGSWISVLIPLE